MEIGFNAGHLVKVILESNPNITLTSFDLGIHQYVQIEKNYIDNKYRFRPHMA